MNNNGWVKIHRSICKNDLWFLEPFTKAQAWLDLVINANHKDGVIEIRGNIIPIKRGQIGWSELTMADRWQWSRNKVRRYLKWLETKQQIEQQKLYKLTSVTTIVNYDEYQSEQQTEQQTIQQKDNRRYTNKNDKNVKNEKKEDINPLREKIEQGFEMFWIKYPNKKGKVQAKKSFMKKAKDLETLKEIINGLDKVLKEWDGRDKQYIPYPATWLNGERWEDEVTPSQPVRPKLI